MRIKKLYIDGVSRYLRPQTIEFTDGLNIIVGRNSVGKSSILDALIFALYGRVPNVGKGLIASRNKSKNRMIVRILFDADDGSEVEIVRKGRIRSGRYEKDALDIFVNGSLVDIRKEDEVLKLVAEKIGVGYRRFSNIIYVMQGKMNRILNPKKEDIDTVLGITHMEELMKQFEDVKKKLLKYEGKDVDTLIQMSDGRIEDLKKNIRERGKKIKKSSDDVKKLEEILEKAKSKDIVDLLKVIDERDKIDDIINANKKNIDSELRLWEASSEKEVEEKKKILGDHISELTEQKNKLDEKVNNLNTSEIRIRSEIKRLNKLIESQKKLLEAGRGKCPTCGQEINSSKMKKIIEDEKKEVERYKDNLKGIVNKNGRLKEKQKALDEKIGKLSRQLDNIGVSLKKISMLKKSVEKEKKKLTVVLSKVRFLLDKLNLIFKEDDPDLKARIAEKLPLSEEEISEKKEELKEKKRELRNEKMKLKNEKNELQEIKELIKKLTKRKMMADKAYDIRYALEDSIKKIREAYLEYVSSRGLEIFNEITDQNIYNSLSIDPKDYRVYVMENGFRDKIPATRTGGGHQTIISLALRIGIIEVLSSLGMMDNPGLMILDEPTYGVDEDNLPPLMEYIAKVSERIGQVILVTHHGLGLENADNLIKVGGRGEESYIEVD